MEEKREIRILLKKKVYDKLKDEANKLNIPLTTYVKVKIFE